ncbi:MAG TPA: cupredoxin domain-containing protein [Candidatus Saccharimonadales bacterium]|nr:cupredoxin domain-containing protein [Candidatus Saccharimonadales bacterium]
MEKNNLVIVLIVAAVLIGVGAFVVIKKSSMTPVANPNIATTPSPAMEPTNAMMNETTQSSPTDNTTMKKLPVNDANAKVFNVTGQNFTFTPNTITVKKGDTVKINFTSSNGFHDWVNDEFSAHTDRVQTGQTASVTFVADKAGTFEYYCSVMTHRAKGMVGKLIVQ